MTTPTREQVVQMLRQAGFVVTHDDWICSAPIGAFNVLISAARADLEAELETERIRLAACGVAALGYSNGFKGEYRSASLDDVLRMRAELESLRKDAESWRAYKKRKDEVIAAGMGRKILRDAAAPKEKK